MLGAWLPIVSIMLGESPAAHACVPVVPRTYVVETSRSTVATSDAVVPTVAAHTVAVTSEVVPVVRCRS